MTDTNAKKSLWGRDENSVFAKAFTAEERDQLVHEDLSAGITVSIELGCVLLGGALLGAFTVFLLR